MMTAPSLAPARFLAPCLALAVLAVATPDSEAQRPGQISDSQGKRWFSKNEAPRTSGLLTGRIEARKAKRRALLHEARSPEASEAAPSSAAETATATRTSSTRKSVPSRSTPASADSIRPGKPAAAVTGAGESVRAPNAAPTKIMTRTPGRPGSGSSPVKRRRTLLAPLFGG